MDAQQRIRELEEEIHRTQKNKATEYHIGVLKAKIAKLRKLQFSKKSSGGGGGFDVKKQGDATVVIVGMPSVGKSTLLTKLTNAESEIGSYEFTTLRCIPGMLQYKGANIQLLDLPGIIRGAKEGRGRGKEVISVVRSADLILILLDSSNLDAHKTIEEELEGFGIRLNKNPPDVTIKKLVKGGVTVTSTKKLTKISKNEIVAALNEFGIHNATVVIRENISIDDLIDVIAKNRIYTPAIVAVNKVDLSKKGIPSNYLKISADKDIGLEELKEEIHRKLGIIKIYTKRHGEEPKMDEPMILKKGATVGSFCDRVHRGMRTLFRYALVWGKSVKHPGQRVGLNHVLQDEDIVQIIKR